jgi:thioredoxin-like negative regulator of GroEL
MRKIIFICVTLGLLSSAESKMKSADALKTETTGTAFKAQLDSGFHFNDKAPNQIVADGKEIKPKKLAARTTEFSLPGKYKEAQANLYVCDDAITVCEIHNIALKGEAKTAATSAVNSKKGKTVDGFIQDDLEAALKAAAKKKQLVLIDFSARWCPGCVRYEKEVFPTQEFKRATNKFVKVKIDVDRFENFALTEKYKIWGIPTFVVVNANEQEIDRLIDFYPLEKLSPFLTSVQTDPTPMSEMILQKETKDPAARLKIGRRLFATGHYGESLEFLGSISPQPPELLFTKVELARANYKKEQSLKDRFIEVLYAAIAEDSKSTRSLGWRRDLIDFLDDDPEEKRKVAFDGILLADELLKDKAKLMEAISTDYAGDSVGFERMLVATYRAGLIETIGSPEESALAWGQAADIGQSYKISPKNTALALRLLTTLRLSKRLKEAEAWADKMLKYDSNNEDIKRRKMELLLSQDKFKEAVKLGEKIIGQSVGRNQFWVAEGLARAYAGTKKKEEAKKLLTAYLSRPEIESDKMVNTKEKMEKLLSEL